MVFLGASEKEKDELHYNFKKYWTSGSFMVHKIHIKKYKEYGFVVNLLFKVVHLTASFRPMRMMMMKKKKEKENKTVIKVK